jgi:hypothetical protein
MRGLFYYYTCNHHNKNDTNSSVFFKSEGVFLKEKLKKDKN